MAKNNNPGRILKGTKSQPSLKGASGVWTLDEALQYHRANQWPQPNLFQPVANSLRLKYNANGGSFFQKIPGRAGNQQKWTYSAWVKRSLLTSATSDDFELFCGSWNNSYYALHLNFMTATDCIQLYDWGSAGGGAFQVITTPVYRDTSAWLHIVCSVDTTQATNTNRVKIWVNGVQVTVVGGSNGWGSSSGFPNQYYATPVNGLGLPQQFGSCYVGGANAKKFDGYISELNFVDGAQLQPTLFGQFDTNNTWVPVPYTGSYGTNGFYLPFTSASTSQTLGYDASLNGTAIYDANQDPYRSSVALHLTGNGPAGGQNNTFADSSTNNLAITRNGTPTQGSFSPYPLNTNAPYNPAVNGASMYTSSSLSSNNYLTTAATSALEFGAGNFTIELWWYTTSTTRQALYHGSAGADWSVGIDFNSTGVQSIGIWASSNGTSWNLLSADSGGNGIGSILITQNAWNHIVYQRNGTTWQSFINGVLDKNLTGISGTITNRSANGKNIGAWWNTTAMSTATGYISSFRIITGQAVYNGNFTPTNKPFGTLTNNLISASEQFTYSGYWATSNATLVTNAVIAPDGTPSATTISSTGSPGYLYGTQTATVASYTFSTYAKAGTTNSLRLDLVTSGYTLGASITFDLNAGTAGSPTYYGSSSGFTSSITSVGNGWYRCSITGTTTATTWYNQYGVNNGLTVSVWGSQLEQASSPSTYVPTPANFSTAPSLLLNFANAAVVDSAGANNIITVNSSTISSASKFGSGALSFNGNTDYMLVPPNPAMAFGTGAFTIEFWHYSPTIGSNTCLIDMQNGMMIRQNSNNSLLTYSRASSTQLIVTGTNTLMPNVWSHVAVVRLNATLVVYINGINQGQWSFTDSLTQTANTYIGAFFNNQVAPQTFPGQLDDLRITAGVARYQSNFTPPSRALPETGGKSFVTSNINAGVVKSFTTTGTTSWTAPSDVSQIEVLVVAGGGGGGRWGGGGGAGGLIYNNQYSVTPGQTYTVTVGAGGAGWAGDAQSGGNAASGGNSVFGNLLAVGGGGGGNYGNSSPGPTNGANGGSGGGGGSNGPTYNNTAHTGGTGFSGQGFAGGATGGAYQTGTVSGGGGGGGAGGPGAPFGTPTGGASLQFGISGTVSYYAGGGGGMQQTGSTLYAGGTGSGGSGGGGAGAALTSAQADGVANTGGGGGGTQDSTVGGVYRAGNGGSGIVIVRYTTTAVGNTSDATTDNLVDSPTLYGHDTGAGGEVVGNYCTWNPLDTATSYLKNGNLSNTAGGANKNVRGTIAVSSGKWYWEFTIDQASPTNHHGVWSISETTTTYYIGQTAGSWGIYDSNGNKRNNGSFDAYGSAYTLNDIGMVALDMDNGKIWWGKNGVWFNSGVPASGTNAAFTNLGGYIVSPATLQYSAASYNFGQRAWAYTPPQGFNALTTKNLPRPVVGSAAATPNQHFGVVTYTGNGVNTANALTVTGLNFQPDFIWIKDRTSIADHWLQDTVRGLGYALTSDSTGADQVTGGGDVSSVNSTGFVVSYANSRTNTSGDNYVAWCWKANGAAVSNTAGTITSQVSANIASGFSVVTYTGNNTAGATVGHGLGSIPNMIIVFRRDSTAGHKVWHSSLTAGQVLELQVTNGVQTIAAFNNAVPTSTTFALGAYADTNASAGTFVAYCWTAIPGFSQFGSYAANGSADGPFVYTGFKPKFVMIKRYDSGSSESWFMVDSARSTYNPSSNYILANATSAEGTGTAIVDFLSNGFKPRSTAVNAGAGGPTYIYMAFAEAPFGNANGTAR